MISCRVTATDRNGVVWKSTTVEGASTDEVLAERKKLWHYFRSHWPDCQIYFNWEGQN